jgi:signal transduction histidine kinase/ActR/RegA family two-component response regulator
VARIDDDSGGQGGRERRETGSYRKHGHTVGVLQAARCVHRLLTRERDVRRLLERTCECLTSPRSGYVSAWIALRQGDNVLAASANIDKEGFAPLRTELLAGRYPPCAKQAFEHGAVFVSRDPGSCDCPMAKQYRGHGAIAAPLGFGDEARGVICAALPERVVDGPAEAAVFAELAEDVAFALDNLEQSERLARERRRLEERVRQTEKMEALGQLASGVAHDFNNQLTGIMGHANLLARSLADEPLLQHAEVIIRACRSAADLNRKLLAFGRRGKLRLVTLELHAVIREVLQLLERSIDKRVEIECELEAERAQVRGDPAQLQNALLNVMLNARDAMPDGGRIRLQTAVQRLDAEALQGQPSAEPGDFLCVQVSDEGVGMDADTQAHVFEPFFTTKPEGKGTGMGMASVYGTVTRHGGVVELDSARGRGTTVTLLLPLAGPASAASQAPPRRPAARVSGSGTVLVVDDEATVRDLLRQMLETLGYRVLLDDNGEDALQRLKSGEESIDLVLLDVIMPGIGGVETLRQLRALDQRLPVLVTSGYNVQGDVRKMLDEGALSFLPKPFSLDELAEQVTVALRTVTD